jgi:DNA-binding transcriptional LysR family regulator
VENNQGMEVQKIDGLWSHIYALAMLSSMGSFTAAAQRLGISKAAMSARISDLEKAAGVPLVRRTTRSVRLTEAGQSLVDRTQGHFEGIEHSFSTIKDLAATLQGLIRVTVPVALGRQKIVPLIPPFLRTYPAVRVEIDLSDRLQSLAQEGFDLAIRHTTTPPQTHVAWRLCETRALLVASRDYVARHGAPEAPQDLAAHNCLYYLRGNEAPTWSFEAVRGRKTRVSVAVRGSFAANNSEAVREAALGGVGIALLPDFSGHIDIERGELVPLLPNWHAAGAFGEHIFAIRPYSPVVPRAVTAFVSHLKTHLSGGFG